jgi:hypothetical protein
MDSGVVGIGGARTRGGCWVPHPFGELIDDGQGLFILQEMLDFACLSIESYFMISGL